MDDTVLTRMCARGPWAVVTAACALAVVQQQRMQSTRVLEEIAQ